MQSTQRNSSLAFAIVAAFGFADLASAQAIIITNANNHQIPLAPGSSVQIDVDGNLRAQCALTNNVCTQLSNGGPNQNAPTVNLSRSDSDADVRTGESIGLSWTSTGASVCTATQSGPVATGWTGPRVVSGGEQVNFASTGAGSYTFSLQCFNTNGGSAIASVPVTVALADTGGGGNNGGGNTTGCDITSTDPAFQPAGFLRMDKTWQVAFSSPDGSPAAAYPNSVGFPVPVGSNKSAYTAIPFTAVANVTVDMTWDTAQANGLQGYSNPRPADSMFISISPCPGDLRAASSSPTDPWLMNGCRKVAGAGSMFYTTRVDYVTNDFLCKLEAGRVYYINLSPVDPGDGLTPGEHTCSTSAPNSANGCDVQMRHTGQ